MLYLANSPASREVRIRPCQDRSQQEDQRDSRYLYSEFQVSCVKAGQAEMNKQGKEDTSELTAIHTQYTLKMFLLNIKQLQVLLDIEPKHNYRLNIIIKMS